MGSLTARRAGGAAYGPCGTWFQRPHDGLWTLWADAGSPTPAFRTLCEAGDVIRGQKRDLVESAGKLARLRLRTSRFGRCKNAEMDSFLSGSDVSSANPRAVIPSGSSSGLCTRCSFPVGTPSLVETPA